MPKSRARPAASRPAHLRAVPVRRPLRPSVIVDVSRDPPQPMTPPFTIAEIMAAHDSPGPIPHSVTCAMWVAAWARAEHCPLRVTRDGRLEPYSWRYEPSDALWASIARSGAELSGVLGFGVPIMRDGETQRATFASWGPTWPGQGS